jgi:hypothetical protein
MLAHQPFFPFVFTSETGLPIRRTQFSYQVGCPAAARVARLSTRCSVLLRTLCGLPTSMSVTAGHRPSADELADTPGSVPARGCPRAGDGHPSTTYVAARLQRPTRELGRAALERSLSGLAPGGVYLAAPVARHAGGLLHHRFTLTPLTPKGGWGGLLSVALSRGSPRVGVAHHPALWSPDVPRRARGLDAAACPAHPHAQPSRPHVAGPTAA